MSKEATSHMTFKQFYLLGLFGITLTIAFYLFFCGFLIRKKANKIVTIKK
jgi:hypothetical protein